MGGDVQLVSAELSSDKRRLELGFAGGGSRSVALLWLRDACRCERCRHPRTGQRLVEVSALPEHPSIQQALIDDDGRSLSVEWAEARHSSRYSAEWLARPSSSVPRPTGQPWRGGHVRDSLAWEANGPQWQGRILRELFELGYARVVGAPTTAGLVTEAAERFGFVRATNYGVTFDVVTVPDPTHLAYADVPLALHTDNPYRNPVPGIQLLHCREASTDGGDSVLLDGLALAEDCRRDAPEDFRVLTQTAVPFRYRDESVDLWDTKPIISLGVDERVRAVHFNDRSMQPLECESAQVEAWYAAYRRFQSLAADSGRAVRFRLQAGDILFLDNERVLHGRTGFSSRGGRRHLEGCYADRDSFESAWRRLLAPEQRMATTR